MLDIKFVRENPGLVKADIDRRGGDPKFHALLESVLENDKLARILIVEAENLRHERNEITERISSEKKAGREIPEELRGRMKEVPARIAQVEAELEARRSDIREALLRLPNILHESVPFGKDDSENVTVRSVGEKTTFDFEPKGHEEVMLALDGLDLERAAKISGSRFYILKNDFVLLEMAIMRLAMDSLVAKGFTPILPPYLMGKEPYIGVTDLGTFEDTLYKIDGEDSFLIATSEHPIGGMHMNETFLETELPLKYAGISMCFRREAGSHGKDTKGIFRVHQFHKIEQFVYCLPSDSWKFHEEIVGNAEEIFQRLELPYRIVNICTGDIGTVAAKKYDLEAWMPVQGKYREMVSGSNCTSYQAVRLNIRSRKAHGTPSEYVHTLNSTAIATTRAIVAIVENFQTRDGTVRLPKALWPYMGGMKELVPRKKSP